MVQFLKFFTENFRKYILIVVLLYSYELELIRFYYAEIRKNIRFSHNKMKKRNTMIKRRNFVEL